MKLIGIRLLALLTVLSVPLAINAQIGGRAQGDFTTVDISSATGRVDIANGASTARMNGTSLGATSNNDYAFYANNVVGLQLSASQAGLIYVGGSSGLAGAEIRVVGNAATPAATMQPSFFGTTTATNMGLLANNSTVAKLCSGGGMTIGNPDPTGGCKGNGILNVSVDIKKNDTAYANPAWVFQRAYTGRGDTSGPHEMPAWYRGLPSLDAHRAFVEQHHELPLMAQEKDAGLFRRGDLVLASMEEAYLYIYQLDARIKAQDARIARLEREKRTRH